jgi:hypothetical protein
VCPFDLAEGLGVTVRLEPLASLEGMYSPDGPNIVIGSLRPFGRRAFTCGHELGHHVLGHGFRIDELVGQEESSAQDDAEYTADRFSAALLMPKLAVRAAFTTRGWSTENCTAEQAYIVAGCLGVGYATLIGYLQHTLRELPVGRADTLARERTIATRRRILGLKPAKGLLVIDQHWGRRPADVEVGDTLLLPADVSLAGPAISVENLLDGRRVYRAVAPGLCRVSLDEWSVEIRVSRAGFRGLAVYRHLEDAEDDER